MTTTFKKAKTKGDRMMATDADDDVKAFRTFTCNVAGGFAITSSLVEKKNCFVWDFLPCFLMGFVRLLSLIDDK